MSRYVNEQKIKQRSLLEPQTRLLGANIIKPPPLAVVILLLPFCLARAVLKNYSTQKQIARCYIINDERDGRLNQ